jgi:hypothetical protein
MKKLILAMISLLAIINLNAQKDIKWGERFYDVLDDCQDAEIIAQDNNGFYMWYCLQEYKGEGEFELNYYVARSDHNLNIDKVVKIEFPHPTFKIEQTWRAGDCVGFILSRTTEDKQPPAKRTKKQKEQVVEKTGTANLYTQFFHLRDMRLMDKPEKFKSFRYFAKEGEKPYLFSFSENKTKLTFAFFEKDTAGAKAIQMEIFDERMRMLWDRKHVLKISNPEYQIHDISVNNEGTEVLIAVRSYPTGKKIKLTDGKAHLIWLTQYEQRQYEQQIEKAWPSDVKCAFNLEGDYLMAGYYATNEAKPRLARGSFAYIYDHRRGHLKNSSTREFKDYETDEMVKEGLPKPSDQTAVIKALVPMIGSNLVMIGEQEFKSTIIPPKRRGEEPTGEDAMYYRDIMITNIAKNGTITSNSYIPKRQKDFAGKEAYNSFAMARDRYGIYIMFNDHIKNYDNNAFTPVKCYNGDKMRTQVNFVQVFSDGSYRWSKAFDTKQMKMPFFRTLYLTTTSKILFFSRFQDHNILGEFEIR